MIETLKQIQQCLKDKMYAHAEMYLSEAISDLESQEPMSWHESILHQKKFLAEMEALLVKTSTPQRIEQEPVACDCNQGQVCHICDPIISPQRTGVGLTDAEVERIKLDGRDLEFVSMTALHRFARAIEAKLKEKNT
jgi:hypothetical protein